MASGRWLPRLKRCTRATILLFLAVAGFGCKSKQPLTFQDKELSRGYENCAPGSPNCTYLKLQYPEFTAGTSSQALEAINAGIRKFVLAPPAEGAPLPKPEALAEQFFADFKKFGTEFPQAPQQWSLERKVSALLNEPAILSLEMNQTDYLGGAHPNASDQFVSLDPATGKRLALADFFKPGYENGLKALAENNFRRTRQIPGGQTLEAAGFEFKSGSFELNDNFAAGPQGLVFYYNPYEIGAYVMGPTELLLHYGELKEMIRSDGPLGEWKRWGK